MKKPARITATWTSPVHCTITDPSAKCVASILNLGGKGWACRIDRCGQPWRYMVVTGTDNPQSIYEMTRELGDAYREDENGQIETCPRLRMLAVA